MHKVFDGSGKENRQKSVLSFGDGILNANKKEDSPIKIYTVHFTGILRVTNVEDFKLAYSNGIGSGKAFGCGMLMLARA